jgi:hypothetical protein
MPPRRTIGRGILTAAALVWVSLLASAQSDAPNRQQVASAASFERTPKAQPASSAAASRLHASGSKSTQRAACVKEGGSCASPEARCCAGLLCVGVKNSFCTGAN